MTDPLLVPYEGHAPAIDPEAFVAPGCTVLGRVRLHAGASVWYGSVLRGDNDAIVVGDDTNVQDGCILHTDAGRPLTLGRRVTVGHGAIVHGAQVDDDALIGMRAVLLNGAWIGRNAIVAAGALVPPGMEVAPGTVVAGVPARTVREATPDDVAMIERTARSYRDKAGRHRAALRAHAAALAAAHTADGADAGGGTGGDEAPEEAQ